MRALSNLHPKGGTSVTRVWRRGVSDVCCDGPSYKGCVLLLRLLLHGSGRSYVHPVRSQTRLKGYYTVSTAAHVTICERHHAGWLAGCRLGLLAEHSIRHVPSQLFVHMLIV
jgi:hypothetical protein